MKNALTILLLFVLFQSSAQNLVPNPSFEDTVQCPFSGSQVEYSTGWYNCSSLTPDYLNSCANGSQVGVPYNFSGYQPAHSGDAYCGVSTYVQVPFNVRESIGRQLSNALSVGTTYYVQLYCNLTIDSAGQNSMATNNLGVLFSTVQYSNSNPAPVNNYSHVYHTSVITDTANWTLISGTFVADSAYTYINIGNFFDDSNTDTVRIYPDVNWSQWSYYLVDDICVSSDSLTCAGSVGITEHSKPDKKLVRIIDTMGRETEDRPNTLLIYVYSDGTTEKVFRVE